MKVCGGVIALLVAAVIGADAQAPPSLFADRTFSAGVGRIADLAFSADGRLIAVVGASGSVAVWDAQAGTPIRPATPSAPATMRVAFGAQGNLVAFGDERGTVSTLDLRSGQTTSVARHSKNVTSLAVAPDGSLGASGDANGDLLIWPTTGAGGAGEKLRDDTRRDPIVFLGFSTPSTLVAVTQDLRIVVWDVSKKRTLRRGTVQLEALGREAEFSAAGVDPGATQLALASQYLSAPRGGVLGGGSGLARPEDIKRTNVIVPYALESGIAGDPIQLGDFLAERVSMSPGSCWAMFSSNYRNQPRMHVWSMVKQGQDVLRLDLPARPTAVQLDPSGRTLAVGFPTGEVRTWRASGTTASDCSTLRNAQTPGPVQVSSARVQVGSEATPLFTQGTGFRVAVLRFEVGGVEAFLGDAVGEMVSGELANSPSVVVVERAAIDNIVKEMQLQKSGLTASDAARIGRGLNAQKVVLGSVRRFGDTTYMILARVVDVETQQVQGSREVMCENCAERDLPKAVSALRKLIVP
jgi:WD40 repeat protein